MLNSQAHTQAPPSSHLVAGVDDQLVWPGGAGRARGRRTSRRRLLLLLLLLMMRLAVALLAVLMG